MYELTEKTKEEIKKLAEKYDELQKERMKLYREDVPIMEAQEKCGEKPWWKTPNEEKISKLFRHKQKIEQEIGHIVVNCMLVGDEVYWSTWESKTEELVNKTIEEIENENLNPPY